MAIPILGNIDVKGQILVDGGTGYGQLEIGGNSGGIIDLKAPNSDDYDLRITASASAHELTTARAHAPGHDRLRLPRLLVLQNSIH